ncbi:PREDICTED: putative F-box protein At3g19560 [Camelina sativa]|uniref:F-box protein At3g19560 n=1 Tax=Camelina sativa TaxID=90675 RepID=A0ABM0XS09_CAMSA|nr:PREDICTED: putative F-box protein At3g19560 [Camelina sativa]
MTIISDLSWELVEEILSRVSITSLTAVGSTCKQWRTPIKDESFTKKHLGKATKECMITMTSEYYFLIDMSQTRFSRHDIKGLSSVKEIEEILSRVSIASLKAVGSTCKRWNALSKDGSFTKKHCGKAIKEEYMISTTRESFMSTTRRFNLHNIKDFPKEIGGMLCRVDISEVVYQCNGLLLLVTKDSSRLVVWNPYLGQTRWIENNHHKSGSYAIGYDNKNYLEVLWLLLELDREEQLAVLSCKCRPDHSQCRLKTYAGGARAPVQSFFIDKEKKIAVVCGIEWVKDDYEERTIMVGEDGYSREMDQIKNAFSYVPSSVQIQ